MALKLDDFKPFLKSYTGTLALVDNELTADEMYFWDGSYIKDGAVLYVENAYIIKGKPGKDTAKKRQYPCNHISIRGKTTPAEGNILVLVSNLNGGGEKTYSTVANFGIGPIDPIGRGLPTGLNSTMQLDGNTKLYTTATPVSNWITVPTQIAVGITQPLLSSDITTDTDSKTLHLTGNSYFDDAAGTDLTFAESSVLSDNVTGFVSLTGTAASGGKINGFTLTADTDVEITYVDGALVVKTAGPITVNGQEMPAGAVIGGDSTNPTFTYSHQSVWGVSSDSPLTITVVDADTFKMTSGNGKLTVGGSTISTPAGLLLTTTNSEQTVDSVTDPKFIMTTEGANAVKVTVKLDDSTVVVSSFSGFAKFGQLITTTSIIVTNGSSPTEEATVTNADNPLNHVVFNDGSSLPAVSMGFVDLKIGVKSVNALKRLRRFRDEIEIPYLVTTDGSFNFGNGTISSAVSAAFACEYPSGTYRFIFPDDNLGYAMIGNVSGHGGSGSLKQLEFTNTVITGGVTPIFGNVKADIVMIGGNATFVYSNDEGITTENKIDFAQVTGATEDNFDINYILPSSTLKSGELVSSPDDSKYINKSDTLNMDVTLDETPPSPLAPGQGASFTFTTFN